MDDFRGLTYDEKIAILDTDAMAAEMGGQRNLPDNIHASGALSQNRHGSSTHRVMRSRKAVSIRPVRNSRIRWI